MQVFHLAPGSEHRVLAVVLELTSRRRSTQRALLRLALDAVCNSAIAAMSDGRDGRGWTADLTAASARWTC
jgi:hypothetical protein